MIGLGSGTIYKMIVNSDGSLNWTGISILTIVILVVFVWRCMVFVPEYSVAVRLRFNRVVRKQDGTPVEYDPLEELPVKPIKPVKRWHFRRRLVQWIARRRPVQWIVRKRGKKIKVRKVAGVRYRFYLINSLKLVDCGDRETDLDVKKITIGDYEFETSIAVLWGVSRDKGCPTKSILRPAGGGWRWRSSKDELESLVKRFVANKVLRVYSTLETPEDKTSLPWLDVEKDLSGVATELYDKYGVELRALLYGQHSIDPSRRDLEGRLAIAKSNLAIADAHRAVADAIKTASQMPSQSSPGKEESKNPADA